MSLKPRLSYERRGKSTGIRLHSNMQANAPLHTCKHYITNGLHSEIITHTIQFGGHNKAIKISGI